MKPEHKILFNAIDTRLQRQTCLGVLAGKQHRQAYYDAGGVAKNDASADAIVSRFLSDAKCKAFLTAMEEEALDDAIMGREEMLQRLSLLARGNVKAVTDKSTGKLKGVHELEDDEAALISEIQEQSMGDEVVSKKLKLHSPTQAMKQLADLQGLNAPTKVAQTNKDGEDIDELSAIERARAILFSLELLKSDTTEDSTNEGD